MNNTIEIEVATKGVEEATTELQDLTDALSNMPTQVVVRNCRDCVINIHPSQMVVTGGDQNEDRADTEL